MTQSREANLELRPGMDQVAARWGAYFAGEIMDRPLVSVTAPREGAPSLPWPTYRDKAYGDMDAVLDLVIEHARWTFYGGEAVPSFFPSFGPDEMAVFCGASFEWGEASGDTNWSVPIIDDWESAEPIAISEDSPLWQRMLAFYRRMADKLNGKMLVSPLDLHTNMDLLAALRGPENLCMDLLDTPEAIDRAMLQARAVFPHLWKSITEAGRFEEMGWDGWATTLACDFSCLISPPMFERWVRPALEEEAATVGRVIYHWDGPDAIKHKDSLVSIPGLHTFSYVPNPDKTHLDHLALYRELQDLGKGVVVYGPPEMCKLAHRELRPEKAIYNTWAASQAEAEEVLAWFVQHT